jgi:hypothetical protein
VSGYKRNGEPSGGLVVFFIIFFFPVGFYLLYKKLTADKTNFTRSIKANTAYGLASVIIGVVEILMTLSGPDESSVKVQMIITFIIIFGGIGYLFFSKVKKLERKSIIYKKYLSAVGMNYISDLDAIAKYVSVDYKKAIKDLQEMINLGYFGDGFINEAARELVIPYRQVKYTHVEHEHTPQEAPVPQEAPTPTIKVVTCASCGANNTITIGKVSECEFCGSPLA